MSPLRVLVTSSRTWSNRDAVHDALDIVAFAARDAGFPGLTVVEGACPTGGDAMAYEWVRGRRRRGWPVTSERHPAKWRLHGRGAGPLRNGNMVDLGAGLCLAFIDACSDPRCRRVEGHGSHGAAGCSDLAEAAGIRVHQFLGSSVVPTPDADDTDALIEAVLAAANLTTAKETSR
ncbi:SLOG family protein [Micromonospora sp. NPDC048986]|uniref:SLOG family protein n=1 Tax=Micromonospora sp. NPDC048986 TaxID=3155644 RepID=UPI0033E17BEF